MEHKRCIFLLNIAIETLYNLIHYWHCSTYLKIFNCLIANILPIWKLLEQKFYQHAELKKMNYPAKS
jgi:hypothetical protein